MRHYRRAWQLKQAKIDWRGWLLRRALQITDAKVVAAKLLADSSFPHNAARAAAFTAQMQAMGKKGGRSTFYELAKILTPATPPPDIVLRNLPPDDGTDTSERWEPSVEPAEQEPRRLTYVADWSAA